MDWTIIADDLTGACDTGVAFARHGLRTRVAFTPDADFASAQVRVVTTEARALPEQDAVRVVEDAVHALGLGREHGIYKKIDSTLRGHPGAELAAVMRAAGTEQALVTPAFPGQGRMVCGGRVKVHGVALEETAFGQEVAQPDMLALFGAAGSVQSISLEAVRGGVQRLVGCMDRSTARVWVADAETEADLAMLAQASVQAGIRLLCGSAGLARALVKTLPSGGGNPVFQAQHGPVLVVCGSYHPIALRQVEQARNSGMRVVPVSSTGMRIARNNEHLFGTERQAETLILYPEDQGHIAGKEAEIGEELARLASGVLSHARAGGLVLTGGETAARVCQALDCAAIDLGGEVQPGIAWGWLASGPYAGLPVVTKAGGFGDENTLVDVVQYLRGFTA
jgi:D-threonate/D-erythronate kinase